MRTFCTLAIVALSWVGTAAQPPRFGNAIYASAQEAFKDLLDALPEESLKTALSGLKGWKDGVFETQHRGVEHVHDTNPALATKIIVAAVHDLKKRQGKPVNSTAVPPPPPSSTPPVQPSSTPPVQSSSKATPPESSSAPPVIVPVTITTTSDGKTVVQTTSVLSDATASVAVTVVSTNSKGQSVTATVTRPAIVMTTTDSAGRTTVQTSVASGLPSSGQILTSTDVQGSTFVTTYTPSAGMISSVKLITTTGSDGKPSTITSYAYVDATATPTTTGKPGLQNGAGKQNAALEVVAACAGALVWLL